MLEVLQNLIDQYGYWAVALGCVVEGEVSVLLGAIAAHEQLLRLEGVIAAAFVGTMISDVGFYFAGRHFGRAALAKRSLRWRARARITERLLSRYGTPAILGFRFVFGLRSVAPFVFGMLNIPRWRFLLLSGIGAALWAVAFGFLGLLLANALQATLAYIRHVEIALLILFVVATAVGTTIYLLRARRPA